MLSYSVSILYTPFHMSPPANCFNMSLKCFYIKCRNVSRLFITYSISCCGITLFVHLTQTVSVYEDLLWSPWHTACRTPVKHGFYQLLWQIQVYFVFMGAKNKAPICLWTAIKLFGKHMVFFVCRTSLGVNERMDRWVLHRKYFNVYWTVCSWLVLPRHTVSAYDNLEISQRDWTSQPIVNHWNANEHIKASQTQSTQSCSTHD